MWLLFRSFVIVCLCCIATTCLEAQTYPSVESLRRTFDVPTISLANVNLIIKSKRGISLYRLQCHSSGYAGDPEFDYSGDFECRLSLFGGRNTFSTLLTENPHQSRDWESRGRFFSADLKDPCASIPNFGAFRAFRLRGMNLTLQITNARFAKSGKLESLRLTVDVREDADARSPIASAIDLPQVSPTECRLKEYFVDPKSLPETK